MELKTKHFGIIQINEDDIIDFPEGIPGFEDIKKFVVIANENPDNPFMWLQGVDNPDVAFVIINPRYFCPDYVVDIDDNDVDILEIKDTNNVLVFSIVVVPDDLSKMTANLKAPVLINMDNKKGKQVTMNTEKYHVRHYILEELRKIGG